MTNTQTRVLTAVVVVPILLVLIAVGGAPWGLFVSAVAGIGAYEFYDMARARGFKPQAIAGILTSFCFCVAVTFRVPNLAFGVLVFGAFVIMTLELMRGDPKGAIENLGASFAGIIYVGVLLSHAILIRQFHGNNKLGIFFIIVALAGSFLCDTGAYFVGRAYGKRKLIPKISPGKTVEGTIGGIITGILAVCVTKGIADIFMTTGFGWSKAALLGIGITIGGIIGDLIESMLKRDAGVKDSGKIVPGHGGILDRLDSLLWAIPVTYYFAAWAVK